MIARLMLVLGLGALTFAAVLAVVRIAPSPWFVLVLPLALVLVNRRAVAPGVLGSSRWASGRDLAPLMSAQSGLLLGRALTRPPLLDAIRTLLGARLRHSVAACTLFFAALRARNRPGELIRLPDVVHLALFAPTGVGKTTGVIVPHLLTCPDSCVVIDTNGGLARATAGHRARVFNQVCVFLDPFRHYTDAPDTLNPLDLIDRDDPDLIDRCRVLAESLIVRAGTERDPTWADSAENLIRSICCYVAYFAPDEDRNLNTVRDIISDCRTEDTGTRTGDFYRAVDALCRSDAFDGIFARMGRQLLHYRDKELASVLTTVNRFLGFLDSPAVQLSTARSSFDPTELRHGHMTVYLIVPLYHVRAQSALLRLWVTGLMHAVVKEGVHDR